MARYEYMICSSQLMRVTFVNGRWQGEVPANAAGALDSCPDLWEFLQRVGNTGWELVSVTSEPVVDENSRLTTLYLKREKL